MTSRLNSRIKKLEKHTKNKGSVFISFIKFETDERPDRETCLRLGRRNIEAVMAFRVAKAEGKRVTKLFFAPEDEALPIAEEQTMTHDEWVLANVEAGPLYRR